jgi:hypothetical protein
MSVEKFIANMLRIARQDLSKKDEPAQKPGPIR